MSIPTAADFDANVEDISNKTTDMADGINSCVEKFNDHDWGCMASDDDKEKIGKAIKQMQDTWNDVLEELTKLASPGNPFWFTDAKESWLSVKEDLSGQKIFMTDASASSFPASQSWVGAEGAVYRDMPGVQASAVDGVVGYAGSFASHLGDHGLQIINLWLDLAMQFIDYAQLVATSVGNFLSADPTKWLNIVSEIINTVSNVVDLVQDVIKLLTDQWTATMQQMNTLENELANLSGSVAGNWPTVELLS